MNELKDNPAGDPSWRTLLQAALHRNRSDAGVRYLQLATVDPWGHPRNRTVVFRGFLGDTDRIQLAVDSRSEKICQIAHCPLAQICWYFCKTREQFRIAGTLEAITADHPDPRAQQHRQQLWQQISEKGRLLWFWPEPKGPLAPPEAFVEELPPKRHLCHRRHLSYCCWIQRRWITSSSREMRSIPSDGLCMSAARKGGNAERSTPRRIPADCRWEGERFSPSERRLNEY